MSHVIVLSTWKGDRLNRLEHMWRQRRPIPFREAQQRVFDSLRKNRIPIDKILKENI